MRYIVWADKTERDGFPSVARLFLAISWGEQIQAASVLMVPRNQVGDAQTAAGAAFDAAQAGNDPGFAVVNVCARCGHTVAGEARDECPI